MKGLKSALSITGIVLALGLAGPGAAQPQQNTFTFRLCNASGKDVIVALAHRASANSSETRFVVRGWAALQQGCADGELPRGWFYYFAIASDASTYWGGDVGLCVSFKGQFERIHTDNYACKADGEVIAPFKGVQVINQPGIEVTLR
jgi:uncharacterized membrane protein